MPLPVIFIGSPGVSADINNALAMVVFEDDEKIMLGLLSAFDVTNTRLGIGTATPAYAFEIVAATPRMQWTETDAGADAKKFGITQGAGTIFFFIRNDADTAGQNFMRVARSGATVLFTAFESGQVAVGTTSPNAAAKLQVDSTTRGFLPPRMTTAQRDAIVNPPVGLVIYNLTTDQLEVFKALLGGTWQPV